jgi:NAD(P)-dependent dehydrogenase (short-subunit alcohol dehydrogenase family)
VNLSLENTVALVTGAGSGMGLATANAFAEAGASVVLADKDEKSVRTATEALAAAGHKAIGIPCDVADEAQVAAIVEQTASTFGRAISVRHRPGLDRGDGTVIRMRGGVP